MTILLSPEEVMNVSGMMDVPPRYSRLIGQLIALAQARHIREWLEGDCPHSIGDKFILGVMRVTCPTCWADFVSQVDKG